MNPSVSLPTKNLIISSYYLKQQKTYPFIKVPPRMVSSGAEEGGINVSLLPLTKETLSVTSASNIKNIKIGAENRRRTWPLRMLGNVLDIKSMKEDVKPLAVLGCWTLGKSVRRSAVPVAPM